MGATALVGAGWLRVWLPRFDPVSPARWRAPVRSRQVGGFGP
jgi:hypothetical protein